MVRLFLPAAGVIVLALGTLIRAQAPNQTYKTPPGDLGTILDAPMVPTIEVAPGGRTVLLAYRPTLPPVAELSEPWIGLAGIRINPRNNGLRVTSRTNRLALVDVATSQERKIGLPAQGTFIPAFSPDGKKLAVTHTTESSIGLLAVDVATGAVTTLVKSGVNGAAGECSWRADSTGLLCYLIPTGRGPAPVRSSLPDGPTAKENSDLTTNWIYRDLLTDAHDEKLFDYYFTSQLAWVDLSGKLSAVGKPAVFEAMRFRPAAQSANDRHLIVTILKKPYQYEVQSTAFPRDIELWDAEGHLIRKLAHQPTTSHRSAQEGAAIVGPRRFQWHATNPHQLTWVEALDDGDPTTPAPHRDRVMQLDSPFTGTASETLRTEWRIDGRFYTDAGHQLVGERDWQQGIGRFWLLEATGTRKLWEIRGRSRMGTAFYNPGTNTMLQHGEHIYFEAEVDSATGLRPVLTTFNLRTLESKPLWESSTDAVELPLAILDTTGRKLLVQRQTARTPPNIVAFDGDTGERRPVTKIVDPQPKVSGIQKRLLTYKRKDGVPLWGTLYLPPDYQPGQRLPTIVWAYPREFRSSDAAAEVTTTTNYFTRVVPGHPLLYALHGYAVLFQPTIPIIGAGDTANDTYLEQLVAGAQAAVDHVVEIGVADRERIGIGGHSYGAFTAANLLAHTDLFRAGIARSGLYNLTLMPTGFQNERRSMWKRPELYTGMSPLWHADKINEPILLIHGAADENPNTPVLQSDLFYMSLRSLKSNVRYVTLPHEGHNYTARESHLHVIAETLEWFDKHLKRSSSPVSSK